MPGARACRRSGWRRGIGCLTLAAVPAVAPAAAPAAPPAGSSIPLAQPIRNIDPLATPALGLRPDRLKTSVVPGPVDDDEHVTVAVGPTGAPASVTDLQRLVVTGTGSYVVRELGPARAAVGIGDTVPPVLELGTVVWQGFSPGRRALTARLTLDPAIEGARLPMRVSVGFRDAAGDARSLGPGARAPVAGVATVTVTNQTGSPRTVATGAARLPALARALDTLLAAAARPRPAVPPVAGAGLPARLPGRPAAAITVTATAPLRVTGTVTGGSVTGPGVTPTSGGGRVAGTLEAGATFRVAMRAGSRLGLRLDVRPWLDPRTLVVPAPYRTWAAWARSRPGPRAVAQATQTLVTAAADAARAAEYSPYLQADAPGPDLSTFTYVVAAPPRAAPVSAVLHPRPVAIVAAAVAALAIAVNAALLRRAL